MWSSHLFVSITHELIEDVIGKITLFPWSSTAGISASTPNSAISRSLPSVPHQLVVSQDKRKHTFRPPIRFNGVLLVHRIWILCISIPQSGADNFVANVRIHHLEPAGRGVGAKFANLAVAQLDEASWARVVAEEAPEPVYWCGVAFTFALDNVVELDILGHFTELERHVELG